MTEQELRALVREAIARHAAGIPAAPGGPPPLTAEPMLAILRHHPSHGMLAVLAGADTGGACIIEPAVPCNHCGYCQSYGH